MDILISEQVEHDAPRKLVLDFSVPIVFVNAELFISIRRGCA